MEALHRAVCFWLYVASSCPLGTPGGSRQFCIQFTLGGFFGGDSSFQTESPEKASGKKSSSSYCSLYSDLPFRVAARVEAIDIGRCAEGLARIEWDAAWTGVEGSLREA